MTSSASTSDERCCSTTATESQAHRTFPLPASWSARRPAAGHRKGRRAMPGAQTPNAAASAAQGTVAVKFGPASMSFRGDGKSWRWRGKSVAAAGGEGHDSTGTSARLDGLTARLPPPAMTPGCSLVGDSEASTSGKAALRRAHHRLGGRSDLQAVCGDNFAALVQALPPEAVTAAWSRAAGGASRQHRGDLPQDRPPEPSTDRAAMVARPPWDWLRSVFRREAA